MSGGAVGQVVASRNERVPEGSWVIALARLARVRALGRPRPDARRPAVAPVSTALGVLGMPGLTAYVGLLDIGRPEAGETVFVSGAAGAVGSLAGQIAKLKGCRVIGSAGSPEKVAWLRELGFDEAFDYREDRRARGARATGIDVYFDNVGGATLEAALAALAPARPRRRLRRRSRSTTRPSRRRGRGTCPTSSRSGCGSRGSSSSTTSTGSRRSSPRSARGCATARSRYRETVVDGHRERPERASRPAPRREHREDARQGRAGRMKPALPALRPQGAEGEVVLPHRALPALRALRRARAVEVARNQTLT